MRKSAQILLLLALGLLSACSIKLGQPFDLNRFADNVEHGNTTQVQVLQWLGEPQRRGIVVNAQGEELSRWMYYYGEGKLSAMNQAKLKTLEVQFDRQGTVKAFNWVGQP